MKSYLFSLFVFLILTSCSSVKEEIPIAGELICTAAGVEREAVSYTHLRAHETG